MQTMGLLYNGLQDQNTWNTFPGSEYGSIIEQLIGMQLYNEIHYEQYMSTVLKKH
jgi:hypothetical protein